MISARLKNKFKYLILALAFPFYTSAMGEGRLEPFAARVLELSNAYNALESRIAPAILEAQKYPPVPKDQTPQAQEAYRKAYLLVLQKNLPQLKTYLAEIEKLSLEIREHQKTFYPHLSNLLQSISTPTQLNLQNLQQEIAETLKNINQTHAKHEKGESPKDFRLPIEAIAPNARVLLQVALTSPSTIMPVMDTLALACTQISLVSYFVMVEHWQENLSSLIPYLEAQANLLNAFLQNNEAAIAEGRKTVEVARVNYYAHRSLSSDYLLKYKHISLASALQTLYILFPVTANLPIASHHTFRHDFSSLKEFTQPIVSWFLSQTQLRPNDQARMTEIIESYLKTAYNGYYRVHNYQRAYFPKLLQAEEGTALAQEFYNGPGMEDCFDLSLGKVTKSDIMTSRFEGPPCRPRLFLQRINKLIAEQEKSSESGLLDAMVDEIDDHLQSGGENLPLEPLQKKISDLVYRQNYPAQPKERFLKLVEEFFDSKGPIQHFMKKGTPAVERYMYLRTLFQKHKIDTYINADGKEVVKNSSAQFTPEVSIARQLRGEFEGKVISIFKEKNPRGEIPESLVRIDGRYSSCPMVGNFLGVSRTQAEIEQSSPWVVFTKDVTDQNKSIDQTVQVDYGANGYPRLIWRHQVGVAQLLSIQDESVQAHKHVAGLMVYTRRKLLIPNLIYTRWLLGLETGPQHLPKMKHESNAYAQAEKRFGLPPAEAIMAVSNAAIAPMIEKFAEKEPKGDNPEEMMLSSKEGLEEFEKVRPEAERRFRLYYRKEMAVAAEQLRKWAQEIENLPNNFAKDSPGFLTSINQELANYSSEAFKSGQKEINQTLMGLVLRVRAIYFREKFPNADIGRLQLKSPNLPNNEDFYDVFIRHISKVSGISSQSLAMDPHFRIYNDRNLVYKIYQHVLDIFFRKLEYLEAARDYLFVRFPILKIKDASGEPIYKNYDDSKFDSSLRFFLGQLYQQLNRLEDLSDTEEILRESLPNLFLTKEALKGFPQYKLSLCNLQKEERKWEDYFDYAMMGAAYMAPMMGHLSGPAQAGIVVLALVTEYARSAKRYAEIAEAEKFEATSMAQTNAEEYQENQELYTEMAERANGAKWKFIITAAGASFHAIYRFPDIKQYMVSVAKSSPSLIKNGMTAVKLRLIQSPNIYGFTVGAVKDMALFPFKKLQLITEWSLRESLWTRLRWAMFPHVPTGAFKVQNAGYILLHAPLVQVTRGAWTLGSHSLRMLSHAPWSLLGMQWASTGQAFFVNSVLLAYAVPQLKELLYDPIYETPLDRFYKNGKDNEELLVAIQSGWIHSSDLQKIISLDENEGHTQRVLQKQHYMDFIREINAKGDQAESTLNAWNNLQGLKQSMESKLVEIEASGNLHNPEYWVTKKNLKLLNRLLETRKLQGK